MPITTPARAHSISFPPTCTRRNTVLTSASPPTQTTLPFIPFPAFTLFTLSKPALTGIYMWFLQSLGEDSVAGWVRATFRPEDHLLLRRTLMLPCQNRMRTENRATKEASQLAGSFCVNASKKKTYNSYENRIQSNHWRSAVTHCPTVLLWKWHPDLHITPTQCWVNVIEWPQGHQNSMYFWLSVAKGKRFT